LIVDPAAIGASALTRKGASGIVAPVFGSVAKLTMTISFIAAIARRSGFPAAIAPARRPTQEELDDEEARGHPIAYFNFAETYLIAAKSVRRSKTNASHKEAPIRFLYYHAI
jgi:hypothetical protein